MEDVIFRIFVQIGFSHIGYVLLFQTDHSERVHRASGIRLELIQFVQSVARLTRKFHSSKDEGNNPLS